MTETMFTLWSRGRPLGEIAFDDDRDEPCIRIGWLAPNEQATDLIPRATINAEMEAMMSIGNLLRKELLRETHTGFKLENTTEYADLAAAESHQVAFSLELRRADGSTVATRRIAVMDTHRLIAEIGNEVEESDDDDAAFDDAIVETAESLIAELESDRDVPYDEQLNRVHYDELPRYQIYVRLVRDSDIP